MTTDGSNGAPEGAGDDDPFAYLYRPADGSAAPSQPRSSYSRPMEVGRAQYGQQAAPRPQQAHPAQPSYGQQTTSPTTPLPPQQSRYAERSRPQPGEDRPSSGRGKGAVIGAVAVIAAVAIGAGIALSTGDPGKKDKAAPNPSASAKASTGAPASPSASASPTPDGKPVADAAKLQAQNAPSASTVKGAISADGSYLTLQGGSTVTWTVTAEQAGQTKFWLHFNNTGSDTPAQVTVNGKEHPGGVTFKNYSKGSTDADRAWYSTNIWPQLVAGTNTLTVTLPAGSGSILLDQVALTPMSVSDYPKS
ncbi:hypothetical protein [Kitasatospora sp. KL5]|uniref:hypothetical protein n=1 Tax=Kitasatospora sp. KL5 TaxID=3425125 RepID=UPI003D6E1DCA